jgi:hypothetical protein
MATFSLIKERENKKHKHRITRLSSPDQGEDYTK